MNKDALLLVYKDEIDKTNAILQKKFIKIDENKSGLISVNEFRKCLL